MMVWARKYFRVIFILCVAMLVLCVYNQLHQLKGENVASFNGLQLNKNVDDPEKDDLIVLYNRVPKTGSTSLMKVLYDLQEEKKFTAAFVNVTSRQHRFLYPDAYRFALNITKWTSRRPAIYHGHFPYLDFVKFGLSRPVYINMIREPLERFASYYYFIRYGDTMFPDKIRHHHGDETSFDECVQNRGKECSVKKLWLQIPYFCGSESFCWELGNKFALYKAKANLMQRYLVVGVTENMDQFLELLERLLPRFFRGAVDLYNKNGGVHVRRTKVKKPLLPETIEYFKNSKVFQMESEFYQFARERFLNIYREFVDSKDEPHFNYVKLMPRKK